MAKSSFGNYCAILCIGALSALSFVPAASAANINNFVYGIYSETHEGIKYGTQNPGDADGGYMGVWNAALSTDTPKEGSESLKVVTWDTDGGVYMRFGFNASSTPVATDMGDYMDGSVSFWFKGTSETGFKVEWLNASNEKTGKEIVLDASYDASHGAIYDGQWHYVTIPLTVFEDGGMLWNRIIHPAVIFSKYTSNPPLTRTFWIDNVVWKKGGTGSVGLALKNRVGGATATQIGWSNVSAGQGWKLSDQFIQMNLNYDRANWGIQIYTDNTASGAVPRYSGISDPAGLVGYDAAVPEVSSTTLKMCWRVVDSSTTATMTIAQGAAGKPMRLWSTELGDQYPCFLWVMDRKTPKFVDAYDYATVWDARGIQHAEDTFGPARSPNYIYLGADFSHAATPRTYKTGTLSIELFYE